MRHFRIKKNSIRPPCNKRPEIDCETDICGGAHRAVVIDPILSGGELEQNKRIKIHQSVVKAVRTLTAALRGPRRFILRRRVADYKQKPYGLTLAVAPAAPRLQIITAFILLNIITIL